MGDGAEYVALFLRHLTQLGLEIVRKHVEQIVDGLVEHGEFTGLTIFCDEWISHTCLLLHISLQRYELFSNPPNVLVAKYDYHTMIIVNMIIINMIIVNMVIAHMIVVKDNGTV